MIEIIDSKENEIISGVFENKSALNLKFRIEQDSESSEKSLILLIDWLNKNHLPIKLDDKMTINILDSIFIMPPYKQEDCVSTNEIILDKVRKLLDDFYNKIFYKL